MYLSSDVKKNVSKLSNNLLRGITTWSRAIRLIASFSASYLAISLEAKSRARRNFSVILLLPDFLYWLFRKRLLFVGGPAPFYFFFVDFPWCHRKKSAVARPSTSRALRSNYVGVSACKCVLLRLSGNLLKISQEYSLSWSRATRTFSIPPIARFPTAYTFVASPRAKLTAERK